MRSMAHSNIDKTEKIAKAGEIIGKTKTPPERYQERRRTQKRI